MKGVITLGVLLSTQLFMATLHAHGVEHHILQGGVGVEVHQTVIVQGEDEIPLSNALVQVFRPEATETPFQTGNTDVHGIFMFNPDTTGIWVLKFMDETGHGKVVDLRINELNLVELEPEESNRTWQKIVSGLGYILFVFSLWILLRKNK